MSNRGDRMTIWAAGLLFLASLSTAWRTQLDEAYCERFGPENTMCSRKPAALVDTCNRTPDGPSIDQSTIDEIVGVHNSLRQKVANGQQDGAAPSSNMKQMEWNDELAMIAQRWADQCIYGHDHHARLVFQFPKHVGQNVGEKSKYPKPGPMDFTWVINKWYDEVEIYTPGPNNEFAHSGKTGHYTQVVWADSYAIGCGFSQFILPENGHFRNLYVCNYGPGGNMDGELLYKVGDPCSDCSSDRSCSDQYPGLCALSN